MNDVEVYEKARIQCIPTKFPNPWENQWIWKLGGFAFARWNSPNSGGIKLNDVEEYEKAMIPCISTKFPNPMAKPMDLETWWVCICTK